MKHPYKEFEDSELWLVIEGAFQDLLENKDIKVNTSKEYVIGYLCKMLSDYESISKKVN